ncbi:MAG: hypothetical protein JWQ39_2345 [Glaciihabitans sp.]|nr:hypothetical protein [Glaciihabitans sp.]
MAGGRRCGRRTLGFGFGRGNDVGYHIRNDDTEHFYWFDEFSGTNELVSLEVEQQQDLHGRQRRHSIRHRSSEDHCRLGQADGCHGSPPDR